MGAKLLSQLQLHSTISGMPERLERLSKPEFGVAQWYQFCHLKAKTI